MNASLPQAQPQTQTQNVYGTVSGTGQQIPLESDAFPSESTFLASEGTHSVGPGDVDLGNPNTEGKSDTLGIQKQIAEAERRNTMPADGISPLSTSGPGPGSESIPPREASPDPSASLASLRPLRKLSSLKWPYVPDLPSYPDPLTRDDPKPLSLPQYEAIARSPAVRRILASQTRLPTPIDMENTAGRPCWVRPIMSRYPPVPKLGTTSPHPKLAKYLCVCLLPGPCEECSSASTINSTATCLLCAFFARCASA